MQNFRVKYLSWCHVTGDGCVNHCSQQKEAVLIWSFLVGKLPSGSGMLPEMHSGVEQSCPLCPPAQTIEGWNKYSPAAPKPQMLQVDGHQAGMQPAGTGSLRQACVMLPTRACCHFKHFKAVYSLHICIFLHCCHTIKLKTSDQAVPRAQGNPGAVNFQSR